MQTRCQNPVAQKYHRAFRRTILLASLVLISILCIGFLSSNHVFAADDTSDVVETTLFGNVKDDGQGCGVFMILNLVVDILTGAIGIVGVVGIIIVGIQYLTAGDNEQQVTKAKRRIAEIILGLAAFAVLYAVAQWLLPGGKLSTNNACTTISDEELAKIKAEESKNQNTTNKSSSKKSSSPYTATLANGKTFTISKEIAKVYTAKQLARRINKGKAAPPSKVCTNCSWSDRIAQTAEYLAWPESATARWNHDYGVDGQDGNPPFSANGFTKWSDLKRARPTKAAMDAMDALNPSHGFSAVERVGADCGAFVGLVVRFSGYKGTGGCPTAAQFYSDNSKYWKKVPNSQAKPGDVCTWLHPDYPANRHCHTMIYLGKGKGVAEAYHSDHAFGHINSSRTCTSEYTVWRAVPRNIK